MAVEYNSSLFDQSSSFFSVLFFCIYPIFLPLIKSSSVTCTSCLPATAGKLLLGLHGVAVDANHGLAESGAALSEHLGIAEVSDSTDNGLGSLGRVARLEDAAADKDTIAAELHHESGISRSGNTTSSEVDDRQTTQLGSLAQQLNVNLELAGELAKTHNAALSKSSLCLGNVAVDSLHVADSLDDVTSAGLTLGSDHGSTLGNTAQGLAEVSAAADKGDAEGALLDVALVIGRGQDLGLVNVVDTQGLEDLALDKVANTGLGHDGDGDGLLNLLDHLRVGHARNAAVLANVGGDSLEGHDGAGSSFFGDAGLLSVGDVHDDATLEHLGKAGLEGEAGRGCGGSRAVGRGVVGHCGGLEMEMEGYLEDETIESLMVSMGRIHVFREYRCVQTRREFEGYPSVELSVLKNWKGDCLGERLAMASIYDAAGQVFGRFGSGERLGRGANR